MPPRKPPEREIKLDAYTVEVDGETYYPHEGESIWLEPLDSVDQALEIAELSRFKLQLEAIQGDADADISAVRIMNDVLADIAAFLARHAVRWTVTDARGNPLPQPDGTPETTKRLGKGLLLWLFGYLSRAMGETAADRKNG